MTRDWSRPRVVAAVLTAALFSPPVGAQLFGGDDVARRQLADQGKRVEALRAQNEELAARLGRLEEALKDAGNPALALAQQLEGLRQEIKQLRGQVEVLGNEIQMTGKRQRDMYVDLDTRMKRLEQPSATGAAPPPGQPGAPAAGVTAAIPTGDAEARAYEAAQNQRKIGNYQGAIAGFRNFLAQYPSSPLAHRALYWVGDSYYNLREFKTSIESQQRLIKTFPDSASAPDALLNIASSQQELGDKAGARKTMQKLVARYPTSDAAEKARRRLATK